MRNLKKKWELDRIKNVNVKMKIKQNKELMREKEWKNKVEKKKNILSKIGEEKRDQMKCKMKLKTTKSSKNKTKSGRIWETTHKKMRKKSSNEHY